MIQVSIIAPSGKCISKDIEKSIDLLCKDGNIDLDLRFSPMDSHYRYSATDYERLQHLNSALECNSDLIWCLRGGYGLSRILHKVNQITKPIAGFSDITALHALNWSSTNIPSYHCLMVNSYHKYDAKSRSLTQFLLKNGKVDWQFKPSNPIEFKTLEGRLIGGNLSVLAGLIGSPYFITKPGDILFLEEIAENHYHVDRMLWAMKHAGYFEDIKAVLLGQFSNMSDKNDTGISILEMIKEKANPETLIIEGLPCGHEWINYPLILNSNVILEPKANGVVKLSQQT
jgi:muramoyltetrapeptide carboxypeptidase